MCYRWYLEIKFLETMLCKLNQFSLLFFFLIFTSSCSPLYSNLGGDVQGPPEALQTQLTPFAKNLIARAYADIDPSRLMDFHTHILGLGNSHSGIWVNPAMQTPANPLRYFRFQVFKNASGIYQDEQADQQYLTRLLKLIDNLPEKGRFMILGFDKHYTPNGKDDPERTEFFIPNEYIFSLVKKNPEIFTPMISIHPYRKDALQKLEEWNKKGVRFIKWLPNAMGTIYNLTQVTPFVLTGFKFISGYYFHVIVSKCRKVQQRSRELFLLPRIYIIFQQLRGQ